MVFTVTRSPDERFADFVSCEDDCWLWQGGTDRRGYGIFWAGGTSVRAHRWSYEQYIGPIPEGLQLDHLCRRTNCVKPMHLELVTGRENQLRGETFSAANAAKITCVNGHPFDEANTAIRTRPGGGRRCRICQREAWRRYDKRRRAQSKAGG